MSARKKNQSSKSPRKAQNQTSSDSHKDSDKAQTKKNIIDRLRIEYTAFMLQNELSFILAPDLISSTQDLINKYGAEAVSQVNMSDYTASQISKECLGKTLKDSIYEDLSKVPFALSFDESSDQFGLSYLRFHVRYIKGNNIQNKILSLSEPRQYTGEELFKMVQNEVIR